MNSTKLISAVGTRYVHELVLELLDRAFCAYAKRDHGIKNGGLSGVENVFATAGILLTIVTLEACRNRIFFDKKKRVGRSSATDLAKFLMRGCSQGSVLDDILMELFTIRDVIVHNHLYSITLYSDQDWEIIGRRQRLLKGYGDDKKFKARVNRRKKKTKFLGLNAQPLQIGFEDLCLVLIVFDVLLRIADAKMGYSIVFKNTYKFRGRWQSDNGIARLLAWYYDQIREVNPSAKKALKSVLTKIRLGVGNLAGCNDSFLGNRCPSCQDFGFKKPSKTYKCGQCDYEIEWRDRK